MTIYGLSTENMHGRLPPEIAATDKAITDALYSYREELRERRGRLNVVTSPDRLTSLVMNCRTPLRWYTTITKNWAMRMV